jgi:DNA-binding NarL/FixJ family response regulator
MPETAASTVHILLLDDHTLFRESASRLLAAEPGFDVAAHCGTKALQILRRKVIDVVLLDFDLGESDGRQFLRLAKKQGFQGKVLVVTAGVDAGVAAELIRSGISGVFRKHDSAALLAQAIRDVMAGKVWLDQEQLQTALNREVSLPPETRSRRFTEREQQVLSYVFEGLANKEIAARIGVSESSVKAILQQLFSKTGVRTRSQLVRIALSGDIEHGISSGVVAGGLTCCACHRCFPRGDRLRTRFRTSACFVK